MSDESSCVKEVRQEDGATLVALKGGIDLHQTPSVHKVLVDACQTQPSLLVVDLDEVEYMDSSGLGTLVEIFRRVNGYKGRLVLCCMHERVRSVFEITKLDKFFKIYETQEEALRA